MDSRDVSRYFDLLMAEAWCPPPARNNRRRIPGVDGVVGTLVAPGYLHRMSLRGGVMAASERLIHSAGRVAAWVALESKQAKSLAAQNCRAQ